MCSISKQKTAQTAAGTGGLLKLQKPKLTAIGREIRKLRLFPETDIFPVYIQFV